MKRSLHPCRRLPLEEREQQLRYSGQVRFAPTHREKDGVERGSVSVTKHPPLGGPEAE